MLSSAQPSSTIRSAADPAARRGAIAVLGETAIHLGTFGGRASPRLALAFNMLDRTSRSRASSSASWCRGMFEPYCATKFQFDAAKTRLTRTPVRLTYPTSFLTALLTSVGPPT